ncbi:MAG TPA: CocE/NonD family hydrolase [Actinomycetes bacterium]|jgi:putative CocE/NonD family hydrolase|nr:CocE/NonD family hydrolase [Actinomycetes bacterium]
MRIIRRRSGSWRGRTRGPGAAGLPGACGALIAAAALVAALVPGAAVAQAGVSCQVVYAPMRDGVRLATEVYRPAEAGRHPVLLTRTPYNRTVSPVGSNCDNASARYFAEHGYVALNQDTRGRYRSEGSFHPMVQEANDGYDAIEWAAAQPWSNAKVGMFGGSYVGLTQWQAAISRPPHLAAVVPFVTASDYHDNWTYVNGVFDLWFGQSWNAGSLSTENYRRHLLATGLPTDEVEQRVAEWYAETREKLLKDWVWQLPLRSFNAFRDHKAPWYYEWLQHPTYDDYWARMDVERNYNQIDIPTLNIGGWYDIFEVGTVRNFQGMQASGSPARLIMRPSAHAPAPGTPPTTVGEVDFGPGNTLDYNAESLRFFDHYLKGVDNGQPAVKLFVMEPPDAGKNGSGFWVTGDTFPLPGTQTQRYLLDSRGHANTSSGGDGVLSESYQGLGKSDSFVYDPRNPVPTVGGNMCCAGDLLPPGAFDQSQVERRGDVLVYTSAPLAHDVTVIGSPKVTLWAKSSAPDTDFTAKLVDVHPDGYSQNILDRVVRASLRNGSKTSPTPIVPGRAYEYSLDLGATANVFKTGHRIRLEISSSNFPHYARNLNNGRFDGSEGSAQAADQMVLHTPQYPSRLDLPIAPADLQRIAE